ncbi:aldo/keto reductase [Ruminiclostridium cellobioparum]|uniref:aldo/keto reductase n=1 Tax=Ruminiclostridium cellobioparum TaxID=29355 RepID=UPI00048A3825|nr:aldo/keto reductase [Ruminiclostridium cellobioparum]
MIYKKYGKTGKDISVIGFGGMRFPKTGDTYDYDKCAEIVVKAGELGVNYFDTAPYYCDDNSEFIMSHAFKNMKKQFYVSTKSSQKDGAKLREQLETSLKRMNLEKINFFHIWCILNMDDFKSRMVKGGAYEAALKAKEEGLIEHIVFSTHCNGDEIETIVNEDLFEGMTVGYNILNFPFRQKGLQAACKKGLGVAVMNPLGGGLIPQKAEYFDFIRSEDDETVVDAALRFNASHDEITTVLAGMGSVEEVVQSCHIGENLKKLDEKKLKEIEGKLFNSMDKLCTGCRYCEHCPKKIPVSKFMLAYNNKILQNEQEVLNNLKNHWGIEYKKAKECIECGICEGKCTQHLPIIARLRDVGVWGDAANQ